MSAFTQIQLERLPVPIVIEKLDYEGILTDMIDDLRSRDPAYTALVESDPGIKLLEVVAYRELILRQRVNESAKACMLAYAIGSDLEHLAAIFGVARLLVSPGNPNAVPPIPPVYESDERLRTRTQLALEGFTTAGSQGSYVFWGLSASGQVKDIDVYSPEPGYVTVTVLSTESDDGIPSQSLMDTVFAALNAEEVRPLADRVTVQAPTQAHHYTVDAVLWFYDGPDPEVVKNLAIEKITEYTNTHHLLGHDIPISGIHAMLHQQGVQRVELRQPTESLIVANTETAVCDSIIISIGGLDE
jgi:phage-related baseplate assembly protein